MNMIGTIGRVYFTYDGDIFEVINKEEGNDH